MLPWNWQTLQSEIGFEECWQSIIQHCHWVTPYWRASSLSHYLCKKLERKKGKIAFLKFFISIPFVHKKDLLGLVFVLECISISIKTYCKWDTEGCKKKLFRIDQWLVQGIKSLTGFINSSFFWHRLFSLRTLPEGMIPSHKINPKKLYQVFFLVNLFGAVIPFKVLVGRNRTLFLAVGELCSKHRILLLFPLPWCTLSRPI